MDPLSIAASIAGLITLAQVVATATFKYTREVKGAGKDVRKMLDELDHLVGVLSQLEHIICRYEVGSIDILGKTIRSCQQLLERMTKKLCIEESSLKSLSNEGGIEKKSLQRHIMGISRAMVWPFSKAETESKLREVREYKTTLSLALATDGMEQLILLSREQAAQGDMIAEIHDMQRLVHLDEERRRILESVGPYEPRGHQENASRLHKRGTGLWFIEGQNFKEWLMSKQSRMWLYGDAGVGKTILMSSIVQAISDKIRKSLTRHGMAFFYCDYQVSKTHDPLQILGSLATQFATQSESSFAKLEIFYKRFNFGRDSSWTTPAVAEDFCSLIQDMSADFDQMSIVVDALDECGSVSNQSQVAKLLVSLTNEVGGNIRSIFSSRNNVPDISHHLAAYQKVSIAAENSDLRLYVAAEIEVRPTIRSVRMKDPNLTEEIMNSLINGADGMWRWVICQLDSLSTCATPKAIREALSRLPPTLNETYERILRRVNDASPDTQQLVHRVLKWMICAGAPLSLKALIEAVSLDEGMAAIDSGGMPDEDDILRWCSSLVRRTADGEGLELAHSTVKEFLETIDCNSSFGKYKVDPQQDNLEIAKICLTYLGLDRFDDSDLSTERFRRRLATFPLFDYAAVHWPMHANSHVNDEGLNQIMRQLFDPSKTNHFMCWSQMWMFHSTAMDDMDVVSSTTTLHWAAMLGLNTVCEWLLDESNRKLDVDKMTFMGTPLCCALRGKDIFSAVYQQTSQQPEKLPSGRKLTLNSLLAAGASLNDVPVHPRYSLTPLGLALTLDCGWDILLAAGAQIDDSTMSRAEEIVAAQPSYIGRFFQAITEPNLTESIRPRYLRLGVQLEQTRQQAMDTLVGLESVPTLQESINATSVLRKAALAGQISIVKTLLGQPGIDIDSRDRSNDNETPLHGACANGHLDVAQTLIEHGADKNLVCDYGWSAYHFAFTNANLNIIRYLEEQGVNTDAVTSMGQTALHIAARYQNASVLQHLLRDSTKDEQLAVRTKTGLTPLLVAAYSGSLETVQYLLSRASPEVLSAKSNENITFAHYIAASANPGKIDLLRSLDFDIYETTNSGKTVLHYLIEGIDRTLEPQLRTVCIAKLLQIEKETSMNYALQNAKGLWNVAPNHYQSSNGTWTVVRGDAALASFHAFDGATALEMVCKENPFNSSSLEAVELLSSRDDIDVDQTGAHSLTPLMILAYRLANDHEPEYIWQAITVLLKAGADVNTTDSVGQTPLHHLVRADVNSQILKVIWLMVRGTDDEGAHWSPAKVESQDETGTSPMQILLERLPPKSNGGISLLDAVAKSMVNAIPETLLHTPLPDRSRYLNLAISSQNEPLIEVLVARGARIEDRDTTPLQRSTLELLCIHGINNMSLFDQFISTFQKLGTLNVKDANGATPLHLACEHGHKKIVNKLLDAGADVEAKADSGLSPIHYAISSGDPGLVEMLLDHNAAITLTGQDWNFSVLHRVDNVEICRLLTDRGVDWKTTISTTIFTDCWVPEFSKADRKDKRISDDDSDADTAEDSDDESDAEMEAKVWESRSIGDISVAHVAVWKNRTDVFEFLMDNVSDIDVNIPAEHGLRPLHLAAIGGRLSFTLLLLSRNANPNVVYSPSEWTPLHFAALVGSEQVVCELLDHGGDPGALDSQNRTPSLVAWEFGHRNLSKILKDKENKTQVTTAETKAVDRREPQNGGVISNALMSAIRKGDAEWCRQLVDYGCNVNGVWTCSCSPLVIACREGHWEVAKYFTSVIQSVRGKTCAAKGSTTGYEAIHYAACAGQHELLNQLLEKDEFPPKVIVEAFRLAALSGTAECLRLLHKDHQDITTAECNRGCCVDWTDHVDITLYLEDDRSWESHECYKSTCLHYAVHLEAYAAVRFLLEIGANLEAREDDGATPLIVAMENDSLKMMEILLHSGANANARNDYGLAPLLHAAAKGTPDMLRLLVQYGVDLSIRDDRGQSALHLAFKREDETMAEALIELGMDPLCRSDSGEAALQCGILNHKIDEESLLKHLPSLDTIQSVSAGSLLDAACFFEREVIVGELLKRAPQSSFPDYVNTTSPLGTPLYAAACAGNLKLTEVLLEYGAKIDLLGGSMGTPLLVACEFGCMEVVKLLLKRGAKLSCEGADQLSMTAMYAARSHKDIKVILQRFMNDGIESLDSPLPVHVTDINKLNEIYTIIGERDVKEAQEKAVELQEDAELEKEAMQELEARLKKFVQTYGQSLQPLAKDENPMILFLKSLRHDIPQIIVEEVESDADSHHSGELEEDQNPNNGVFGEDTYKDSKSEAGWNSESDESEVIDRENLNQLADQILRPYEESICERQASQMLSDGSFLFDKLLGSSVEGSSATRLKPDTICQVQSSTHVCVEMEVSWESISSNTQRAGPVPEFKAILSTPHEIHESSSTAPLADGTTQDRQERRERKKAQIRRLLYREISKRIG